MPDQQTLARQYRARVRGLEIRKAVKKMAKELTDHIEIPNNLAKKVAAMLRERPQLSWDSAVAEIAG